MNDMLSEVLAYLDRNKGRWPDIAKEAGVGYDWLNKFGRNQIAEPGYHKVLKLHAVAQRDVVA